MPTTSSPPLLSHPAAPSPGPAAGADAPRIITHPPARCAAADSAVLKSVGITPVAKTLGLDLGGLLTGLDPTGGFFGHDKIEGVATTDGGRTIVVSNDSDFGVDGISGTTPAPPYTLHAKTLPNGTQDDGEYLAVDTTRLPAATSTATVTITVK
ncbi:hypothetical protein [Streptomyces roseochromogenus]|uniref:Phytase-like domain-containing protein n=1 Tax=Streptomyces roseochromogenus subsp. oscitans DS 12.976 TaxID=1352936 RepID=V6KDF4_STRRC|nr:hypothetical protein [Streptomyces roseochromogenus]EST29471.1 hypothetical protein M878_20560 [Streptomyces roseochromogenus subsp. oscitans DS 12.976]